MHSDCLALEILILVWERYLAQFDSAQIELTMDAVSDHSENMDVDLPDNSFHKF